MRTLVLALALAAVSLAAVATTGCKSASQSGCSSCG
jgi:hypothetical protein